MPETDCFIITDAKGKMLATKVTVNMIPDSSQCIFIQKKSNIGIVPEDKMIISGGKKTYNVALKPAVSLVSLEELESVASAQDEPSARSLDEDSKSRPTSKKSQNEAASEDDDKQRRQSRIRPPTKRPAKAPKEEKKATELEESSFKPMKRVKKPIQPVNPDELGFTASDFQIPDHQTSNQKDDSSYRTPNSHRSRYEEPEEDTENQEQNIEEEENDNDDEEPEEVEYKKSMIPAPKRLEQSPTAKKSGIPSKHRHPDLPPDADVLEQSLRVKFSFKEDAFSRPPNKSSKIKWYDDDAFDAMEEPDFTFEMMMTPEDEDPVFCLDGDYYDSSGRLLSVQQGKGKIIFVTEQGQETDDY